MKKRLLSKQVSQLLIAGLSSLAFTHTAYAVDGFLSNPSWEIQLTSAGYSDYLGDHTPGFLGREYLSGEWGAAADTPKPVPRLTPSGWKEISFTRTGRPTPISIQQPPSTVRTLQLRQLSPIQICKFPKIFKL